MHRRHALRLGATVGLAGLSGCSAVGRLSNETEQTDTSRLRWTREFQSRTYREPLRGQSTLVHVTETVPDEDSTFSDTAMRLVGLSPEDGSKQWEYVGESDDPSPISETWLHDSTLLASWGSNTVGLTANDGVERWRTDELTYTVLFDEEQWYTAWTGVVAFEPRTGENNWVLEDERRLQPVAIGEDTLYVRGDIPNGGTNELAAVDPATGRIQWQTDVGTWRSRITPVLLTDNTLVTGSTDGDSPIAGSGDGFTPAKGIDATTGEVRWTYTPETRSAYPRATVGGLVLLETRKNETTPNGKRAIVAVDPTSGERRWRRSGTRLEFHDVTTEGDGDGLVYLSMDSEKVLVLDAADGSEKWQYEVQADEESRNRFQDMKLDSGTLFVTHGSNRLTALDATSGVERWTYRAPERLTRHWTVDSDTVYLTTENAIHALERD